jgi:hypothetical protein
MTRENILEQIRQALDALSTSSFDNWHGVTPSNLARFRVVPYEIVVADDEGGVCTMWMVLDGIPPGYGVAFEPGTASWAVVERHVGPSAIPFLLVVQADSLARALAGM